MIVINRGEEHYYCVTDEHETLYSVAQTLAQRLRTEKALVFELLPGFYNPDSGYMVPVGGPPEYKIFPVVQLLEAAIYVKKR